MSALERLRPSVAVISARGGSKRFPRKNIAPFFGVPIIVHTIRAALEARCFERVVVSTDDEEIATIARENRAEIDVRPEHLATDAAGVVDVCLDLLRRERGLGRSYRTFCALYPTAPLRNAADIVATMSLLDPGQCDFAMAVTEYDLPPYRALRENADGTLEPMWPEWAFVKSQQAPILRVNNASTYAATVDAFERMKTFTGPGCRGHFMPRARSTDIDYPEDLDEARAKASRLGWREIAG
ncbi:MAG: acylneuraminate cytidylyltransferase family protein [Rhodospirillales bacterium]|nr:acylneuraminate cytidylyltransferase family protein [Rhodospirillales bacterium]